MGISSNTLSAHWKEPLGELHSKAVFPGSSFNFQRLAVPKEHPVMLAGSMIANQSLLMLIPWRILLGLHWEPSSSASKRARTTPPHKGDFSSEVLSNFQLRQRLCRRRRRRLMVWGANFFYQDLLRLFLWGILLSHQQEHAFSTVKTVKGVLLSKDVFPQRFSQISHLRQRLRRRRRTKIRKRLCQISEEFSWAFIEHPHPVHRKEPCRCLSSKVIFPQCSLKFRRVKG